MTSPHILIETDIEHMRLGAVFVLEHRHPLGRYDLGHRIVRVPQVRYSAGIESAGLDAGRIHALRDPVVAEVAFVRDLVNRMEEAHTIRAGHDAVATSDAPVAVYEDNAITGLVGRAYGTYLHARRVIALVAELRHEKCLRDIVGIDLLAINDVLDETVAATHRRIDVGLAILGYHVTLDPGPGNRRVVRYLVLILARLDA